MAAPGDAPPAKLDLAKLGTPRDGGIWCHASAAAWQGRGVLILGPTGSGKSLLALGLLAFGVGLIADDGVLVRASGKGLAVSAAPGAPELIEARGVGLLKAELVPGPITLALAVDLGRAEPERLPPPRNIVEGPASVPLILARGHPNLSPVILQYLRAGRGA